jgi:hypothetical protein
MPENNTDKYLVLTTKYTGTVRYELSYRLPVPLYFNKKALYACFQFFIPIQYRRYCNTYGTLTACMISL